MRFEPLFLSGAWRITPEPKVDARGSFTTLMDAETFAAHGLETGFHQHAVSFNAARGTLRGMHFQASPHGEAKLVRCTSGAVYDVIVDIREGSPTYLRHAAITLTAEVQTLLYIPAGFAHGFLTLTDASTVEYHITAPYVDKAQRGLRWNDSKLAIAWPEEVRVISARDARFKDWDV